MRRRYVLLVFSLGLLVCAAGKAQPPQQFRVWGDKAAAHPYLGDAGLNDAAPVPIDASAQEKQRGFVLFFCQPFSVLPHDFAPGPGDRCVAVSAADCPGEYGPVAFGIEALRDLELTIACGELQTSAGQVITRENLDLRAVRYVKISYRGKPHVIPLLIEKQETIRIPAGRFALVWTTYYIPPDAPAGDYDGRLSIASDGKELASLPLRLTVYPLKLQDSTQQTYIYYNNSTNPSEFPRVLNELIDQRLHGMKGSTLIPPVRLDGELPRPAMARVLDLYKKAGFTKPVHIGLWNRITAEWLNTPDRSIKMYGPWFRYYPFSDKLDRRYVDAVRMIRDEAKARGIEFELEVADEPGSHPWTTEAAQHYNDLIRRELPDVVRELTVGGGWAMGRAEHELWKGRIDAWTSNRWLADKLEIVQRDDPKARIGIYNMAGGGSGPGGICTRSFYGFFLWKTGAVGAAQWTYWHSGTPEDNHTWPAADGRPVPTLRWEAAREGAKDLRYLTALETKLKSKQPSPESRKLLEEIRAGTELRTMDYDPIAGGRIPARRPQVYDQWRRRIAELIMR